MLKACAGMTRKKANEIANVLIPKYEDRLFNPPKGQSFRECYDVKKVEPTPEWRETYLRVKQELIDPVSYTHLDVYKRQGVPPWCDGRIPSGWEDQTGA